VRLIVDEMALEFLLGSFATIIISPLFHTLHRPMRYAIPLTRQHSITCTWSFQKVSELSFFIISSDMPATE
jgi:hypothetical protein